MMTQEQRVLLYLEEYGSISSLDAFRDLGITRLSAVIWNLKAKGFDIKDEWETVISRYGETEIKRYMRGDD